MAPLTSLYGLALTAAAATLIILGVAFGCFALGARTRRILDRLDEIERKLNAEAPTGRAAGYVDGYADGLVQQLERAKVIRLDRGKM